MRMPMLRHGLSRTPEYRAWQTMRHRCTSPESPAWESYGGRGITIAPEWLNDPAAFIAHIGPRPSARHEVDRIDNDRGYEPGNVRWVTRSENDRNRRSNVFIEFNGERLTLAAWTERTGIPSDTLKERLRRGWSVERSLTEPVQKRGPDTRRRAANVGAAARSAA